MPPFRASVSWPHDTGPPPDLDRNRQQSTPALSGITINSGRSFFRESAHRGGTTHNIEGVPVRIYGPAKTIADCFKYCHKIGIDVAVEALKDAVRHKRTTIDEIHRFAKVCRFDRVMRPYLEAIVKPKNSKNIAASLRAKLLNLAQERGEGERAFNSSWADGYRSYFSFAWGAQRIASNSY